MGQVCFWCFQTLLFRPSCRCRGNRPTSGPYNSPPRQQCAWRLHKPTAFSRDDKLLSLFSWGNRCSSCSTSFPSEWQRITYRLVQGMPKCFYKVKEVLSKAVLLHHPQPNRPTSLTVDVSNTAIGAQLEQRQGGSLVTLAFFSRKLSDSEKKYSAFDRELLASYGAIRHFRHFLEGRPFTLYTDHKPLTPALKSQTERSPRQARHLFHCRIYHGHPTYQRQIQHGCRCSV